MNKKGFTLIELLAVIVILAVIALIVTPTITGVISSAKKSSDLRSAEAYVHAANNYYTASLLDNLKKDKLGTNVINDLEISNHIATGSVIIDNKGNVELAIVINDKCYIKNFYSSINEINISNDSNNCSLYKDSILNGADPVLSEGMIPIYYEGNIAKKANTATAWYNYTNKEWANVVLVDTNKRKNYEEYEVGTVIDNADVLAYLVWIPRYKIKLFNVEGIANQTPTSVSIIFENKSESKSNGTQNDEWLTLPGFSFNNTEMNGLWISKFEITGTADRPTSLPNKTSLVDQSLSSQYLTALKFNDKNMYGVNNDAHLMRNEEWATMAYLSHSIYGLDGQIRTNNYYNSGTKTGCGASVDNESKSTTCAIEYGNASSYPQSTTGNITGIFDTAGGAWERVMVGINDNNGYPISGQQTLNSGFTGYLNDGTHIEGVALPDKKYYTIYDQFTEKYDYTDVNSACSTTNCLGLALLETNGWYQDNNRFPIVNFPWMVRGGSYDYTNINGIFCFNPSRAYNNIADSFRITMF